eukprot:1264599-Pleurochrysis_carterae.AAC.3
MELKGGSNDVHLLPCHILRVVSSVLSVMQPPRLTGKAIPTRSPLACTSCAGFPERCQEVIDEVQSMCKKPGNDSHPAAKNIESGALDLVRDHTLRRCDLNLISLLKCRALLETPLIDLLREPFSILIVARSVLSKTATTTQSMAQSSVEFRLCVRGRGHRTVATLCTQDLFLERPCALEPAALHRNFCALRVFCRRSLLLCAVTLVVQQFSGMNNILNYSSIVLRQVTRRADSSEARRRSERAWFREISSVSRSNASFKIWLRAWLHLENAGGGEPQFVLFGGAGKGCRGRMLAPAARVIARRGSVQSESFCASSHSSQNGLDETVIMTVAVLMMGGNLLVMVAVVRT